MRKGGISFRLSNQLLSRKILSMLRALLCLSMACAANAHQHTVAVLEPSADWRREGDTVDGGRVCPSTDVRNSVNALLALRGCRVVEGYLQITLIYNVTDEKFHNFTFPELKEITGYLLLYEVTGLRTLGQLFPNLAVIRGDTLFENYALVVYNAVDLEALGLRALRVIVRGAVRIEENPKLCYLDTVNWPAITSSGSELFIANKVLSECEQCAPECESGFCWAHDDCTDPDDTHRTRCHELCLGGCEGPGPAQCHACRGVRLHGECLDKCPADRLEYLGLHCLTERQCRSMEVTWPFDNSCVEKCPQSFAKVFRSDNKTFECKACGAQCPCFGARIDSIAAAQHMKGCTFINGSLEIEIRGGSQVVRELEENLGKIQEIYGSLKVVRSFLLSSLSFLKDLRIIRGEHASNSNYSLIIHNNQNLKQLWDRDKKPDGVKILNGRLFIHNNPKLCISEIEKFNKMAGLSNFTKHEVSEVSNGDKVSCNHKQNYNLVANVTIIYSKSVLLEWEQDKSPTDSMVRYIVYYILAPNQNVTTYDERGACGESDDNWKINYVNAPSEAEVNVHHPLTRLEPYSQYAYYVTMVTSQAYTVRQSSVRYFRTLPDRPSVPIIVQAGSTAHSQIELQWEAPRSANGVLAFYIVSGMLLKDEKAYLDQRDYCQHPMVFNNPGATEEAYLVLTKKRWFINCCGKEEIYEIKDAYDYKTRCESREHGVTRSKEEMKVMSEACKDFFHSYLTTHLPKRKEDDFSSFVDKLKQDSKNDGKSYEDSWPPWGYVDPDSHSATSKNDSKPDREFVKKVDANTTRLEVTDLRHFARYSVKVMACRQAAEENKNTRCSFASLVTVRSRPKEGADDIDEIRVKVTELNNTIGSVQIFWTAPKRPNGGIVSYNVEYSRVGEENAKPVVDCLTRKRHEKKGGIHVVENLQPGKYGFRIRANSLAGVGPFSEAIEYEVADLPSSLSWETHNETILGVTFGTLLLLGCVSVVMYYWRSRLRRKMWLVASVNPDYRPARPYFEDHWELSRDKVEIGRRLGRGSFGLVFEGTLMSESPISCAIKTIDNNASARERSEFLKEASVMKSFVDGYHVIRLLGVVSRGSPPLVVMELMALGDLKTYLREMREGDCVPDFSRTALIAAQIADGMAFLEARKFVHRDLAARNCLVGNDLTVKVGDFGMTKDVYDTDYYRNQGHRALPVRWMSPESLSDGLYSSQSDVWSYGVVLWELATLASQPYQGLANEQVASLVLGGGLLQRPPDCPDLLHSIMSACWKWRAESRPNFGQIMTRLDASVDLGLPFRLVSFFHSRDESRVDICSGDDGQELVALWSAAIPCAEEDVSAVTEQNVCKLPPPPKKLRLKNPKAVISNNYENAK